MKNLHITVELSSIAMDSISKPQQPTDILQKARQFLNQKMEQMGRFITCQLIDQRSLADDMQLAQYDLQYEKHTLHMQFMFLNLEEYGRLKALASINKLSYPNPTGSITPSKCCRLICCSEEQPSTFFLNFE